MLTELLDRKLMHSASQGRKWRWFEAKNDHGRGGARRSPAPAGVSLFNK